jgi:hypothetical protein
LLLAALADSTIRLRLAGAADFSVSSTKPNVDQLAAIRCGETASVLSGGFEHGKERDDPMREQEFLENDFSGSSEKHTTETKSK